MRGKGSGRSIEAFDLLGGPDGLRRSTCVRYGGHRAAAGLEIERGARGGVRRGASPRTPSAVLDAAQDLRAGASASTRSSEARSSGMALAEELQALAPFGRGNPRASR